MSEEQLFARLITELDRLHVRINMLQTSIDTHVAESSTIANDLRELVTIWRARKVLGVIMGGMAAAAAAGWQLIACAKEHIR